MPPLSATRPVGGSSPSFDSAAEAEAFAVELIETARALGLLGAPPPPPAPVAGSSGLAGAEPGVSGSTLPPYGESSYGAGETSPVLSAEQAADPYGTGVPYINQFEPAGSELFPYEHGDANCAPTSMAMIAKAMGKGQGTTDAQLVSSLADIAGTTGDVGTPADGIPKMAQALGVQSETKWGAGDDTITFLQDTLASGKMALADGATDEGIGHYIAVVGMDAQGNFLVQDPADPQNKLLTPEQMQAFLARNSNGGIAFSVG